MKKILYITLLIVATAFYSCQSVSDKEIILFDGENRLAFTKDSVKVNLAELKIMDQYKITIPVRVMGYIDTTDNRPFEVEIINGVSSSFYSQPVAGKQYEQLPKNYLISKDSINGYVEVEFLRENFEDGKIYELRLKIKPNDYFNLGVVENLNARIIVLNFLERPEWWARKGITSEFHSIMLTKLFEVYGKSPITDDIFNQDFMGVMAAFKRVSDWLNENPQYGVSFNSKDQEYFQMFI